MRIALTAMMCAVALAACGSSSRHGTSASSASGSKSDIGLTFARCMRAHGVSNFPDPQGGGNGINITIGSGLDPQSPAFKAARAVCFKDLPGRGPGPGPPSAQAHAQLLKTAECMRAHGISDFPDPTSGSPPSPENDQYSAVLGRGGYFLAVPSSIDMQSPAFKQAATTCNFGGP